VTCGVGETFPHCAHGEIGDQGMNAIDRAPFDVCLDAHTGTARSVDEGVEIAAGRLQPGRAALVCELNDFAQVCTGPDGGLAQFAELHRLAWLQVRSHFERTSLHSDQCEFVADGVVQVVGDTGALLRLCPLSQHDRIRGTQLRAQQPVPTPPPGQHDREQRQQHCCHPIADRCAIRQGV